MKKKILLAKNYHSYTKRQKSKAGLLRTFRLAMSEIVFRTTKLEGEPVTRRMVNAFFK